MPFPLNALTRRDFLKLAGLSMAAAFLPADLTRTRPASGLLSDHEGRIAAKSAQLFDAPGFDANPLNEIWQDITLPITEIAISKDEDAHNRIWYKLGDEGYAYSGDIQPVRTRLNKPLYEHPEDGRLAEVSVPYTDARREPSEDAEFAYRLYYETTHWVVKTIVEKVTDKVWYQLRDDKWKDVPYYVLASHLRIIPTDELIPISPDVPEYKKSIEVRLRQQIVVAYEGSHPVFAARASTGTRFASGSYYTPQGIFTTYYKRPSRHMATDNLANSGYDLPGVPWVLYITKGGVSFHGTYWHNDFGAPRSHGCINLAPYAAKWLYRWAAPLVEPEEEYVYGYPGYTGTHVEIIE